MLFGSAQKKSVTYGALIDIGSGSVGVGIVASDHTKEKPSILYSERIYMRIGQNSQRDEVLRYMKEALFTASLALSKNGISALKDHDPRGSVSRILVTCSSPWAHTVSRTINFSDEKPFKVTSSLLEDLITSAEEEVEQSIKQSEVISALGLAPVERATVGVLINEYRVHNPIGKKATKLTLSQVTGFVPQEVIDAVDEVQEKVLPDTTISTHTYMLVAYCVIRELFSETSSYTIIDVTGETTEIGIVVRGDLAETVHVPFGSNTLLRTLAESEKATPEHARSLIRSYAEGALHENEHPKVASVIKEYETAIRDAVGDIHEDLQIPKTMVVTALPDIEPFFRRVVPSVIQQVTETEPVLFDFAPDFLKVEGKGTNDVFISLVGRFFHKLHSCGDITSEG